jgi:hypothetical protein
VDFSTAYLKLLGLGPEASPQTLREPDHTIMMSPKFYTEESAGIPFVDWVRAMVINPFGTHGPWLQGRWQNLECEDCADPTICP